MVDLPNPTAYLEGINGLLAKVTPDSKPGRMVMSGLQVAGGVTQTVGGAIIGVAAGWTGVGAVVGGAMIAHGVNNVISGGADMYYAGTNQAQLMGTVNPLRDILYRPVFGENADTAYMIADLSLSLGGAGFANASKLSTATKLTGSATRESRGAGRLANFLADETGSWTLGTKITGKTWNGKTLNQLAEIHINDSGKTILGHLEPNGGYIGKAQKTNASYFDIGDTWNSLSKEERWAANKHFLDVIAEKGDQVYLSVPKTKVRSGSYLVDELNYLTNEKGYQWVNQWSLVKK